MGQQDVLNLLVKTKEPITSKQIAKKIKVGETSVNALMNKLVKENLVGYIYNEKVKKKGRGSQLPRYYFLVGRNVYKQEKLKYFGEKDEDK